jgi:(2Fe-2S) ferredoxin
MPRLQHHVFVCVNARAADHPQGSCQARGGSDVRDRFKAELKARGVLTSIRANNAGCLDQCAHGVAVVVYPEQIWYGHVTVADVAEIIDRHLLGGCVVERLLLPDRPRKEDRRNAAAPDDGPERSG